MWKQPSIIFLIKAAIVLSIYFFFGQSPIIHLSITKIGLDHLAKKKRIGSIWHVELRIGLYYQSKIIWKSVVEKYFKRAIFF